MKTAIILFTAGLMLAACSPQSPDTQNETAVKRTAKDVSLVANADTGRWYSNEQLTQGKKLYSVYCAGCHGANAESTPEWKTPDNNGNYPPPPLNGSGHAWHHPIGILDQVIRDGGKPIGGVMPAWGKILNFEQRLSVIAAFQVHWSDELYTNWLERETAGRRQ